MTRRKSLIAARVVDLNLTCEACPTQWEGRTDDDRYLYVRYRWGRLQIGVGRTMATAVEATIQGSGDDRVLVVDERIGDEYDGVLSFNELANHVSDLAPGLDLSGMRT